MTASWSSCSTAFRSVCSPISLTRTARGQSRFTSLSWLHRQQPETRPAPSRATAINHPPGTSSFIIRRARQVGTAPGDFPETYAGW